MILRAWSGSVRALGCGLALATLVTGGCAAPRTVADGPSARTVTAAAPTGRSAAPPPVPAGTLMPSTAGQPAPRPGTPATTRPAPQPSVRPAPPVPRGSAVSAVGRPQLYGFRCGQSEAEVAASGAPRVTRGTTTIYAGAQQVGGSNQDPRIARFDGGRPTWCRDDYERSGDDGRAYGLVWSGDVLLAVFSAVGTQGDPSGDLRRFTASGWLTSYSAGSPRGGGGAKVAAVVRVNPATGSGLPGQGTWITADNNGKVNSATVTALAVTARGVQVTVDSAFAPRGADRTALRCSGSSPFRVRYTFDSALRSVIAIDAACA